MSKQSQQNYAVSTRDMVDIIAIITKYFHRVFRCEHLFRISYKTDMHMIVIHRHI